MTDATYPSRLMIYRICKSFEVESGHMLSKHPGACRYPHGHSRRIEVVVASRELDANQMVCDFSALKWAIKAVADRFDHAMAVNSTDPLLSQLQSVRERVVVFENQDPTTEVLARHIFDGLAEAVRSGRQFRDDAGRTLSLPPHLVVERVRVGETSSSWAEYGQD